MAAGINVIFNTACIADDGANATDIDPDNTGSDEASVLLDPPVGIKTGHARWCVYSMDFLLD